MSIGARHPVSVWAAAALVTVISLVTAGCTGSARTTSQTKPVVLTCRDSAGQQPPGSAPQRLVNGVDGFIGDTNPYDLVAVPVLRLSGARYLTWKTALAVAPTAKPYRTVSVLQPASARLDYSTGKHPAAPSRQIRLPVCGHRFTLFVGGIFVRKPACVDLAVAAPGSAAIEVKVPILTARC